MIDWLKCNPFKEDIRKNWNMYFSRKEGFYRDWVLGMEKPEKGEEVIFQKDEQNS